MFTELNILYAGKLCREGFPDFARSNEPCTSRMANGHQELALECPFVRLEAYGECRDSERPKDA